MKKLTEEERSRKNEYARAYYHKTKREGRHYYATHSEKVLANTHRYYQQNKKSIGDKLKAKYAADPLHFKNKNLKNSHGITLETYEQMCEQQHGRCKICGKQEKLFVDHDHVSGKIRGLLCLRCNFMLGYALDNPVVLRLGASYLEE